MFEKASRLKLRFETKVGKITVEDLWDLPLQTRGSQLSIDEIGKNLLDERLKTAAKTSLVTGDIEVNAELELRIDILKSVITYKLERQERLKRLAENQKRANLLTGILAEKEEGKLKDKSTKELKKMIRSLQEE